MSAVDSFRDIGQRSRRFGRETVTAVGAGALTIGAVALLGIRTTIIRRLQNPDRPIIFEKLGNHTPRYDSQRTGWVVTTGASVGICNDPNDQRGGKVLVEEMRARNGKPGRTMVSRGADWVKTDGGNNYTMSDRLYRTSVNDATYFGDLDLEIERVKEDKSTTSPLPKKPHSWAHEPAHTWPDLDWDEWIPMDQVVLD